MTADTTKADQLRALREGRFKTFDKSVRAVKELREKIAVVGKKKTASRKARKKTGGKND